MPTREREELAGHWFEDPFTRGDLSAVDELVASDFVGYGTDGDGRIHETHGRRASREWLRW